MPTDDRYNMPIGPRPKRGPHADVELTFKNPALVETRLALLAEFAESIGFKVLSTSVDVGDD